MAEEQEQEQEQEMISHFSHQHPFTPIPESRMREFSSLCRGCWRYVRPGEAGYGCSDKQCRYLYCFHKECLEMPREIRHPLHPSHPLKQLNSLYEEEVGENWICAVCEDPSYGKLSYICSEGCELYIHLTCAMGMGVADEEVTMKHPSHPLHGLRYLRRPCSFQCDACGTTERGCWYGCSICQYWIHETCARLPHTASFPHHHHPLSVAFVLPFEYIRNEYTCDVCNGVLRFKQWVYHCKLCRYVAHLKCATNTSLPTTNNEDEVDGSKDIIKFPINEVDEELIKPFIAREIGERGIGIHHEDNKIINGKYHFHNHPHPLKLIMSSPSSSSSSRYNDDEEEEDDDDDDGDDNHSGILQLSCDGCTMPIQEHKQGSSPNYYLSCGECKYFLHLVCFDLPLELPCLPVHSVVDHKLTLRNSDKMTNWTKCSICLQPTNGLYYGCNKCRFKVDIKCASLPDTIKHAAHPQRHHYLKLRMGSDVWSVCAGCYGLISGEVVSYRCDSCRFAVCGCCVLLPATNKHRSEKHLLPLTYDANLNHPSEFYCGECETRMNPKRWMYHCPDCDQSFHPFCLKAISGWYRNLNFGSEEYMITPCHPQHPLRFQVITKKKYCDLCHVQKYNNLGFQCASCNFAMCFESCGAPYLETMKANQL